MSALTLEDLAEMSGGERIESRVSSTAKDPFTTGIAFPIEIEGAKHTVSKNGFEQVELQVSIVQPDGSLKPAGRLWETLPLLEGKANELAEDRMEFYRNIFGRNLLSFLRAIDPGTFNVYHRRQGKGSGATYFDADGTQLTSVERRKRTELVENAVIGAAKAIKDGKLDLTHKRLWVVKAPGSNGKLYTNYFHEAPEKYPAMGDEGASADAIPF